MSIKTLIYKLLIFGGLFIQDAKIFITFGHILNTSLIYIGKSLPVKIHSLAVLYINAFPCLPVTFTAPT